MIQASSVSATQRPLRVLAAELDEAYARLQPASDPERPSPGDRLVRLGERGGGLVRALAAALGGLEDALRGLDRALRATEPALAQADAILALGGVVAGLTDGAARAAAGLADVGADLASGPPNQLLASFEESWPQLGENYQSLETHAAVIPPPEDLALALAALAPLLNPEPPDGERSLPVLRAALVAGKRSPP